MWYKKYRSKIEEKNCFKTNLIQLHKELKMNRDTNLHEIVRENGRWIALYILSPGKKKLPTETFSSTKVLNELFPDIKIYYRP